MMKCTCIFLLFLALLFSLAASAGEEADISFREKQEQARKLAEEVLTGRELRVRVYNNWREDPKEYKHVSVKLDGLSFGHDAVKAAFGGISKSAVLVVAGQDQSDQAIGTVLGAYVYVEPYDEKKILSIWPRDLNKPQSLETCIFKDSVRRPIPNAEVEIWMGVDRYLDSGPRVMIAKAKLDEAGVLQTPRFVSSWRTCFIVHHPDCGPIQARYVSRVSRDEPYKWFQVPALPKDKWCTFTDALGEPIPNATVEIFLGRPWGSKVPESLGKAKLDEEGRLTPPYSYPRLEHCCFTVSHPEYGTVMVDPRPNSLPDELVTNCTVPLVRAGSKADERSIWGTIVDPNGNPVAGAMIMCFGVRTPGRGNIPMPDYDSCRAVTDQQGRFYMYLPIATDSSQHGKLVPLASKYSILIESPKGLGLQTYSDNIDSGQETSITMVPTGYGGYFHTFTFADEIGPITDPNLLREIELTIKYKRGMRSFQYDTLKQGRKLPLGTYQARTRGPKGLRFEAIEVTKDSPTHVIFKVQEAIVYHGQVVHGITGQPMQGAIVVTGYAILSGADASAIKPGQWDLLHSMAANSLADDQALAGLPESFKPDKITQTDENGRFRISFATGEDTYFSSLYALEKDYLCASYDIRDLKPDNDRLTEVPTMKLFPAATLVIEPNIPVEAGYSTIDLRWSMDPNNNPPWLSDFRSYCHSSREASVVYNNQLRQNIVQSVHVPAGLEMTISVLVSTKSELCPVIIPGIKLEQGQVLDLGRREFQPALKVAVKVVDSKGEPVEGVAVQCWGEGGSWRRPCITNETGTAFVDVPPRSKGKFVVSYHDSATETHLNDIIPYEVGGKEDAGRQFTLQISDEMVYHLFK